MAETSRSLPGQRLLFLTLAPVLVLAMGNNTCSSIDADGDGWSSTQGDCDDQDPVSYPGAPELCDGVDNDCNGQIDDNGDMPWYRDSDLDGYGSNSVIKYTCTQPAGYLPTSGDCNDYDASIHPGAFELCDGVDNDCDKGVDDGPGYTWYLDADGDGYGRGEITTLSCSRPSGYTLRSGDCDDADPTINPDAMELCDGLDNNCDGRIDEGFALWFEDRDGDGFGAPAGSCARSTSSVQVRGDCDDDDSSIHPGAADVAGDGMDGDCGGTDGADPSVGFASSQFSSLQAALDASVDGETIWVGPGTYLEHDLTFKGRAVALRSTHFAARTVVDAGHLGRVFQFLTGEGPDSILDGFTITRGMRSADGGGGIYISVASPRIERCIFSENEMASAPYSEDARGGAIYLEASGSVIENCLFIHNDAAGLAIDDTYCEMCSEVPGCWCDGELSLQRGLGGAVYAKDSDAVLRRCRFIDNTANFGAAIYLEGGAPWIASCALVGNTALELTSTVCTANCPSSQTMTWDGVGGGIYVSNASPIILGATMVENASSYAGGFYATGGNARPVIDRSILAYNGDQGLVIDQTSGQAAEPTITWSDVYEPTGQASTYPLDQTNLSIEPGFLSYDNGLPTSLHLAKSSPLIDAGDPAAFDLDGTRVDPGIYGGSDGGYWDQDDDGVPDWFWPGALGDAPSGFDPGAFDCDDQDPSVRNCAM